MASGQAMQPDADLILLLRHLLFQPVGTVGGKMGNA
jgi:hypothetical protein